MRAIESAAQGSGTIRRILDLRCGTGRFTNALAEHFGAEVIGLDPSVRMLEQATSKIAHPGADSVLARLQADVMKAGLERLRAHARAVDPLPATEPIDVLAFIRPEPAPSR